MHGVFFSSYSAFFMLVINVLSSLSVFSTSCCYRRRLDESKAKKQVTRYICKHNGHGMTASEEKVSCT